ncbi:hypothetical protein M8494_21785 [Serratia ureilytica]
MKYFALLVLGAARPAVSRQPFFIMDEEEDSWLTIVLFIAVIAGLVGIGMVPFVGSEPLLIGIAAAGACSRRWIVRAGQTSRRPDRPA